MPTTTRRKAPVMFHRRLWLLAGLTALVLAVLVAQAARLTVWEGDRLRAQAESRLTTTTWLPTWRGEIRDRVGRVLARDEPRWEVRVSYDAITDQWAEDRATAGARRSVGRTAWATLSPETRAEIIARHRPEFDDALDQLWDTIARASGMTREEVDTRVHAVRGRVQRMAAVVWDQQRRRHEARFEDGHHDFSPRPIAEQTGAHALIANLPDAPAASLQSYAAAHPDLIQLAYARDRAHPQADVEIGLDLATFPGPMRGSGIVSATVDDPGGALVGRVRREVWAEDLQRRPFRDDATGVVDRGGYRLDDVVGASGVEAAQEDRLRGHVGLVHRDREEGEVRRESPEPGQDITLTIDAAVQARLEAVLDPSIGLTRVQPWHANEVLPVGTRLAASAVVLDVPTGEILAMASSPTVGTDEGEDVGAMSPWLIRPVQVAAPPGSIVKPLVLAAATAHGALAPDEIITCDGHHFEGQPGIARCWIYRPRYGMAVHGPLGAREALARSCNCWFYELGERLGVHAVSDWLGYFGLGEAMDIGLTRSDGEVAVEVRGTRPRDEVLSDLVLSGEATFESLMMAIGQGRSAWTPLHAANAYAILARGGRRLPPTLVRGHEPLAEGPERLLPSAAVAAAIDGLRQAVSAPWGTAGSLRWDEQREPIFRVEGPVVAAKTGTAQAPPLRIDLDGDGVLERVEGTDHAWVVALVSPTPEAPPTIALAVLVEHGGAGGRVAGPIADQIIRALQAEGWLPRPSETGA